MASQTNSSAKLAVLIPAHNEEKVILATLTALQKEITTTDQVLVIADNCSDSTAAIARSTGVQVIERDDQAHTGKGYALDFGLKVLTRNPPDVVTIIDADCIVTPGSIQSLKAQTLDTGLPAQAIYLVTPPQNPDIKDQISAFAFKVKNLVRPQGLASMGLCCSLTGTGMAFPWAVISSANLASGEIVEDMKLGLDLAISGSPPRLCPESRVFGQLPSKKTASTSQRTRWEHGHLNILFQYVPRLVSHAFLTGRWSLILVALDLAIPPLSLLVLLWVTLSAAVILLGVMTQIWIPAFVAMASGCLLLLAILNAWALFGRQDLSITSLLSFPFYLAWKIPLYFKFLIKPQQKWVRTDRDGDVSNL